MKNIRTRTLSAVIFGGIVWALYYYGGATGLKLLCSIAPLLGGLELVEILLPKETPRRVRWFFYGLVNIVFLASLESFLLSVSLLSFVTVIYSSTVIMWYHKSFPLTVTLDTITRSVFGFIYLGIFPAFAAKILDISNGPKWFAALLCIVFFGDIFAYFIGSQWGSTKIMPSISPQKSVQGVAAGFLGSLLGGVLFSFILPDQKTGELLLLALIIGGIAQYGDFFESLMKRVADIKDSGSIMPGHGGVLDRIDGVLFASPIVYFFAQYLIGR